MNRINDMTKEQYESLLKSGMFYEMFPEATGNYVMDSIKELEKECSSALEQFEMEMLDSMREAIEGTSHWLREDSKDSSEDPWKDAPDWARVKLNTPFVEGYTYLETDKFGESGKVKAGDWKVQYTDTYHSWYTKENQDLVVARRKNKEDLEKESATKNATVCYEVGNIKQAVYEVVMLEGWTTFKEVEISLMKQIANIVKGYVDHGIDTEENYYFFHIPMQVYREEDYIFVNLSVKSEAFPHYVEVKDTCFYNTIMDYIESVK